MFAFRSRAGGSARRSLRPKYEDRIGFVLLCVSLSKFQTCFSFSQRRGAFCCGARAPRRGHRAVPAKNNPAKGARAFQWTGLCVISRARPPVCSGRPGAGTGLPAAVIYVGTCSRRSQRLMDVPSQDRVGSCLVAHWRGVGRRKARPPFPAGRHTHLSL